MESFRPGVADRLGIGYETLKARRPDLVYLSLTGFGPKGPYAKGYEGVVAAKTGRYMAFAQQNSRQGPNYGAVQVGSHSAAMALARGAISALMVRDKTGYGQKVETSLLQALTPYDLRDWLIWQMMIKYPAHFPEDPWARFAPTPGYLPARTKDGRWIQLANMVDRLFRTFIHHVDMDFIFEDPRFETAPILMEEDWETLREMILARIQEKTLDEWMDIFVNKTADVAAEPFLTAQEGMDHPQIVHDGAIQYVQDPRVGRMRQLGPLVHLSLTPGRVTGHSPDPVQHTEEVLSRPDGGGQRRSVGSSSPLPGHPLEGITVLDLTSVIAGPLGCAMVSELGARVIRVEAPEGDWVRRTMHGILAHRTMAGSEGLCLNLKTKEGQEIVHGLVARSDVLVHSMRPGAPERIGIGYDQLQKINPRLIYVYAAGYGNTGPHSHRPAMHPIPGAVCGGAMAQMGRSNLPSPEQQLTMDEVKEVSRRLYRSNQANPDQSASMVISVAVVLGLYARERLGKPQYIVASMLGANAYAKSDDFFLYEGKPPRPVPDPDGYGINALYRLYRAGRGWVFLACPFEEEWRCLCRAIGRQDLLVDTRYSTAEARLNNDDALARELAEVFATKEPLEWEVLLTSSDVACVEANDRGPYHFFAEDPHVEENGFTTQVEAPLIGSFWRHSPMLNFSLTPGKAGPGVLKGQHTQDVLKGLGYGEERILDLRERGVVDWDEPQW